MFDSFNGNFDLQKNHINGKGEYVITAGLTDNGVMGKTDVEAKIFEEKTITVDMFGAVFFRQFKYKMVTHARVFSLKPKFKITERQGLFLVNSFHFLSKKFGYENMCSWAKIKHEKIQLPIQSGEIDFEFMESFIAELEAERVAELEAERVAELEAYLLATGLKDYHLTEEEERVLSEFGNNQFSWSEFRLGDLFEVRKGKRLPERVLVETNGEIALINQSTQDNMVARYSGLQSTNEIYKKNAITFGVNTKSFGYQKNDFYTIADVLFLKSTFLNEKNANYFIPAIKKQLPADGWDKIVKLSQMKDLKIQLPTHNQQPDYEIMQTFISAIQKLVIKDVVLYADKKIAATKKIIQTPSKL